KVSGLDLQCSLAPSYNRFIGIPLSIDRLKIPSRYNLDVDPLKRVVNLPIGVDFQDAILSVWVKIFGIIIYRSCFSELRRRNIGSPGSGRGNMDIFTIIYRFAQKTAPLNNIDKMCCHICQTTPLLFNIEKPGRSFYSFPIQMVIFLND